MSDPLNEALALLGHAAKGEGNVELDRLQAAALLVDRSALWGTAKQLKASEQNLLEVLKGELTKGGHLYDCPLGWNSKHCSERCERVRAAVAQAQRKP